MQKKSLSLARYSSDAVLTVPADQVALSFVMVLRS